MTNTSLQLRLSELRRRLLAIAAACGAGWALCAAAGLLILAMWLDLMIELPAALRVSADLVATVVAIVLCARLVIFAFHDALPLELGRRIDRAADARGQVVSGIDLMLAAPDAASPVSRGLAQLGIERAEQIAGRVPAVRVLPADPLRRMGQALFGVAVLIAAVFIISPRLATTQLARNMSRSWRSR